MGTRNARTVTRSVRILAAVAAIAITGTTLAATPAGAAKAAPTYRIQLTRFVALEETDEVGADEIYATYDSSTNGATQDGRTAIESSVDRGEIHAWKDGQSRHAWGGPTAGKAIGADGLGIIITLWEHDDSNADKVAGTVHDALSAVDGIVGDIPILGWIATALKWVSGAIASIIGKNQDDFINKSAVAYNSATLARLTSPGMSFADVKTFNGDGGRYAVEVLVTRAS